LALNKWIGLEVSSPYWEKGKVIAVNNGEAWVEILRHGGRKDMATVKLSELKQIVQKPTFINLMCILDDDTIPMTLRIKKIMDLYEEYYES